MSLKKQAIVSVLANWTGTLVQYVIALIATPIIVHSLGNEKYGIWSLAISVTGYYGIIDFGIRATTVKFFSQYNAQKDESSCNVLINTVLCIYFMIMVFIFILTWLVAYSSGKIFKIDSSHELEMFIVIMVVGGNLAVGFIFNAFSGIVVSLRRFDIQNTIIVIISICRSACIILFLKLGYKLIAMAVIVVCFDAVTYLLYFFFAFRLFPKLKIALKYFSLPMLKDKLSFTGYTFLIHFSRIITERTDQVIIGIFMGSKYIVYYAIAESLIAYVRKIPKNVISVLLPFTSYLDAKGEKRSLEGILYIVPKYVMVFSLFIFFIFYEYGRELIRLWMGEGYDDSYLLLVILIMSEIIVYVTNVIGQVFLGMGENKVYSLLSVFGMISNVGFSLFFMHYWGLYGIALGKLVSVSIVRGLLFPFFLSRSGHFSILKYLKQTIIPATFAFGVFIGIYYLISYNFTVKYDSIINLIAFMCISSLLYITISYFIALKEISFQGFRIVFKLE